MESYTAEFRTLRYFLNFCGIASKQACILVKRMSMCYNIYAFMQFVQIDGLYSGFLKREQQGGIAAWRGMFLRQ